MKVFEKCVYGQISEFFNEILSNCQCGFRKGHGVQHYLKALLKKWLVSVNQGLEFRELLTDPSKAFDYLPHGLLLAKLPAYRFDTNK